MRVNKGWTMFAHEGPEVPKALEVEARGAVQLVQGDPVVEIRCQWARRTRCHQVHLHSLASQPVRDVNRHSFGSTDCEVVDDMEDDKTRREIPC